jgi:hypothetical protein
MKGVDWMTPPKKAPTSVEIPSAAMTCPVG